LFDSIVSWASDIAYSFGYAGIAVLVALGTLHLPIPPEIILPLAGFLVGQGRFSFLPTLIWTTVASVAVSLMLYWLGRWLGEGPLRSFVRRFGRFMFVGESDLDRAIELFEQHAGKAILIGRLTPGVTSLISIPVGMRRMPLYGPFMIITVLDSLVWNGAFIGLGWALGSEWTLVERYSSIVDYVALAAIAGGVIWFVWHQRKKKQQE
jgi:membrane protein DedA with SNARE-associated domain